MAKYRKKPVIVEAIQYKIVKEIECKYGTHKESNSMEICKFMNLPIQHVHFDSKGEYIIIKTLEGDMRADIGDYIIKGVSGEFYPCKPDIFEKTYEELISIKSSIQEERKEEYKMEYDKVISLNQFRTNIIGEENFNRLIKDSKCYTGIGIQSATESAAITNVYLLESGTLILDEKLILPTTSGVIDYDDILKEIEDNSIVCYDPYMSKNIVKDLSNECIAVKQTIDVKSNTIKKLIDLLIEGRISIRTPKMFNIDLVLHNTAIEVKGNETYILSDKYSKMLLTSVKALLNALTAIYIEEV